MSAMQHFQKWWNAHGCRLWSLEVLGSAAFQEGMECEKKQCAWRSIEWMHEDHGPCNVIHLIDDPSNVEVYSVNDCDFKPEEWTHFAPVAKLLSVDAELLIEEMKCKS